MWSRIGCDTQKKLMAAARAWAKPPRHVAAAAERSPHADVVAAHLAAREARKSGTNGQLRIEICPDERDAVSLFFALSTQWRRSHIVSISGSVTQLDGIDYGVIPSVAGMLDIAMTPALFGDVRDMERAAREAMYAE
jgi:Phage related hypothetical protein (DUF1799)